jgi:hypothetical protein
LHDDPCTSNSCLIPLLPCLAHFPLTRVLILSLFFFSPTLNYSYKEIWCWFGFVCREWCRNETSNFEYFPISAYARRAIINKGNKIKTVDNLISLVVYIQFFT